MCIVRSSCARYCGLTGFRLSLIFSQLDICVSCCFVGTLYVRLTGLTGYVRIMECSQDFAVNCMKSRSNVGLCFCMCWIRYFADHVLLYRYPMWHSVV